MIRASFTRALILTAYATLLSGCPFVTRPVEPVPPGKDQYGCDRPAQTIALNKHQLEVAGLSIGKFALGKVDYRSQPELVEVMTKASGDLQVAGYLLCVAKARKDIDPDDLDQINYLRQLFAFLQTKPTPDQLMEWQKRNPFPRKRGKLEVSGPFARSNTDKLLSFSHHELFKSVTVINTGNSSLTWWLDGFPTPYFFSHLHDGKRVTTPPKDDYPFHVSRTNFDPEKHKSYPFKVKADTDEQITITLQLQSQNPDPYTALRDDFLAGLQQLRAAQPREDEQTLALKAAENLIEAKFPEVKGAFREILAAQLLFSLRYYDASVAAYGKAEASDPDVAKNPQYKYFLALASYFAGRPKDASKNFTQVSKLLGMPIASHADLYASAIRLGVPHSIVRKNIWSIAAVGSPASSYQALVDSLPKRLARATGGDLEIEEGSRALKPADYVTAVQQGVIDIAVLLSPTYYKLLPVMNIGSLPGLFESVDEYWHANKKFLFQSFDNILWEKYNLFLLGNGALPGSMIFTTKPIYSVTDLKGLKVRVVTTDSAILLAHFGAQPIVLPDADLYMALDRGIVAATLADPPQGYGLGIYGVAKYAYDWKMGGLIPWFLVANQHSWNSLPGELRATLVTEFQRIQTDTLLAVKRETEGTLERLKEKGVLITTPSSSELQQLRDPKILNAVYDDWLRLNNQHGIDAKELLAQSKRR